MLALKTSPTPIGTPHDEFQDLVLPLAQDLRLRALRFERSAAEAHDLVQDTLERAFRSFDQFRRGTNVRVWLYTIMFHLFIDRCRRRAHETLLDPGDAEDLVAPEPEPPSPWEGLTVTQVRDAIARLESPFREIGTMHWVDRRSYREISERLSIPLGTVGTRLLRARRKLRGLLEVPAAA
jgi:RNA polymerase sigma-70 factor (ECF subfamily)